MSSVCYGGYIRMNPEVEIETRDPMFEGGYPHKIPKVYIEGYEETYFPQYCFDWDDDSVIVVRDKRLKKYTCSRFLELLAKNEKGEIVWMDGRRAPYSECWEGEYLDEVRGASEYRVEEYDFEKFEKRRYKVTLDETSKFDVETLYELYDFLDSELIGSNFVIKDGVLKKYFGKSSNLVIPDGVTEIGYDPFVSVHDFEVVIIPKTLVNIPSYTFTQCTAKSINVDKDNPKYYSKDGCLIDRETGTLVWAFAAKSIPDDNSIKEIGYSAFAGRKDIERIVIPDGVTKIGSEAFCECTSLASVVISGSIAIIGNDAFRGCSSLSEIRTFGVGIDLSEVISGKGYVRNGDEWTINNQANDTNIRNFARFRF